MRFLVLIFEQGLSKKKCNFLTVGEKKINLMFVKKEEKNCWMQTLSVRLVGVVR